MDRISAASQPLKTRQLSLEARSLGPGRHNCGLDELLVRLGHYMAKDFLGASHEMGSGPVDSAGEFMERVNRSDLVEYAVLVFRRLRPSLTLAWNVLSIVTS